MLASVVQVAQRRVDEAGITHLSMRDRDTFLSLIESDAEPDPALQTAADRYRQRRG